MTFIRASGSKVVTNHELIRVSSGATVLSGVASEETGVATDIKSLGQYRKTFDPSYKVSILGALVTNTAGDPVSCETIYDVDESKHRRYLSVTELMLRFRNALQIIGNLNSEAVTERSSAARDALAASHPESASLSKADKYDALLHIEIAAADTRNRKQNAIFSGRAFYSSAV